MDSEDETGDAGHDHRMKKRWVKLRLVLFLIGLIAFAAMAALRIGGPQHVYFSIFQAFGVKVGWDGYGPYFDLDGILSALQCHNAGLDVFRQNPCDPSGRVMAYSPVWLALAPLGLGSGDLVWTGAISVIGFLGAFSYIANPRTPGETSVFALALFSTSSLYAMERLNVDVLLFILVAPVCLAFGKSAKGRIIGYGAVFLAALLKYYPIAAFGLALTEKTSRLILIGLAAALGTAIFLDIEWHRLVDMQANIPYAYPLKDAYGSGNVFVMLGQSMARILPAQAALVPTIVNIAHFGAFLGIFILSFIGSRKLISMGATPLPMSGEAALFIAGTFTVAFTFFAGQNAPYRGIWLMTLLPFLIDLRRKTAEPIQRLGNSCVALILILLWFEDFHAGIAGLIGPTAGDRAAFLIREPLWWIFITAIMTLLWVQLADTPLFRRLRILPRRVAQ